MLHAAPSATALPHERWNHSIAAMSMTPSIAIVIGDTAMNAATPTAVFRELATRSSTV